MMFRITFTTVAIMLLYALPGFLMVRTKLIKQESISAFASMLMYVCTPALTFYSLNKIEYSAEIMGKLGLFFVIAFFIMLVFATLAFLVFRKKYEERQYRIYTIASFLGNCTFMGVPLLEALFPEAPIAVAYSIAFFLAMNIICWTFGSYVITQDRKYISLKKVFINPAVLSVIVAVPLWMLGFPLPGMLMDSISLLGRMTTPLCMMVLGMRLATLTFKTVFGNPMQYVVVAIKQLALPLVAYLVLLLIPADPILESTLFIIFCTPIASVVLNFAEMLHEGQETAAGCVLLGSMLSIVTIPVLSLLL